MVLLCYCISFTICLWWIDTKPYIFRGEYFYLSRSKLLLPDFSSSRSVIFKSGYFVQKYWSGTVTRNTVMRRGMNLMICIVKRQLKWSLKSWKRRQDNELGEGAKKKKFKKHRHRRNVTSHHSFSLLWHFSLSSLDNFHNFHP